MADGWIATIAIFGLLTVAIVTSLIVGAWERVQKYRVDRTPTMFGRPADK